MLLFSKCETDQLRPCVKPTWDVLLLESSENKVQLLHRAWGLCGVVPASLSFLCVSALSFSWPRDSTVWAVFFPLTSVPPALGLVGEHLLTTHRSGVLSSRKSSLIARWDKPQCPCFLTARCLFSSPEWVIAHFLTRWLRQVCRGHCGVSSRASLLPGQRGSPRTE